jgi:hypothetical protein
LDSIRDERTCDKVIILKDVDWLRRKDLVRLIFGEGDSSDLDTAVASDSIQNQILSITLWLIVVIVVVGSECIWSPES